MTVSHMFYDRKTVDCSINYQAYERDLLTEKPDDKMIPDYSKDDGAFQSLVQAIVLGTYTYFDYNPSVDEAKILFGRLRKVAVASLEGKDLAPNDM